MTDQANRERNARLGMQLFILYALFYLAFVLVNAFAPTWVDWQIVAGLNLAIVWGFALIGVALLLAIIYGAACGGNDKRSGSQPDPNPHRGDQSR